MSNEDPSLVRVDLRERSYDIRIEAGLLERTGELLSQCLPLTHVVVITDDNVRQPHADRAADSLRAAGVRVDVLTAPAGEATKSVEQAHQLWLEMLRLGADRKSAVLAVGGGVVGDLAGFIAATFARGIPFIQAPTTLLAHVDSSVGGKVGVNLPQAKNMVGAFWQPAAVLIDTDTLDTLPEREYRAGLAEVVKYGVILDEPFFTYLEQHIDDVAARKFDAVQHIIRISCQLKADVVKADEREETGLRAVLNYGHTFCHAIEAVAGYGRYLHGEAVSIGMLCASRLAESMQRIEAADTARQHALLEAFQLPLTTDLDADALIAAMQRDKKVEHGRLRFVLPTKIGHVELVGDVDEQLVRQALRPH